MNERDLARLAHYCLDERSWPLMICLLGNFQLLVAGELVPIRAGSKSEALLAYLGLQSGRRVPRERLVQALWPDRDPALASHSLRTLVYQLHKLLGPALNDMTPVLHEDGYYRLNDATDIGVDVMCFDVLVETGDQQVRAGDAVGALVAYERAAQLYRGDLYLAVDVQMVVERERLLARYLTLLARLADYHYRAGDYSACLAYLWRLLAREPGREDAHRLVMQCYVRRGERAMALRQYQVCVDILRTEFGIAPEPATIALLKQIRDQPESV